MSVHFSSKRQRWVVLCDPLTIAQIKVLAASNHQSVGFTLDQAVTYFSHKVQFNTDTLLQWGLPDDFPA